MKAKTTHAGSPRHSPGYSLGDWPYLLIDATYLKVRRGGRIVYVAVIIAVGVNTDGQCSVPGT